MGPRGPGHRVYLSASPGVIGRSAPISSVLHCYWRAIKIPSFISQHTRTNHFDQTSTLPTIKIPRPVWLRAGKGKRARERERERERELCLCPRKYLWWGSLCPRENTTQQEMFLTAPLLPFRSAELRASCSTASKANFPQTCIQCRSMSLRSGWG